RTRPRPASPLFPSRRSSDLAAIAYFAHLSDRLGRKRVLVGGSFACMLIAFPVVALLGSGDLMLVLTGYAIGNIAQAAIYGPVARSEEHTSELQSRENLVCRL